MGIDDPDVDGGAIFQPLRVTDVFLQGERANAILRAPQEASGQASVKSAWVIVGKVELADGITAAQ
jgi:hypothetical protein